MRSNSGSIALTLVALFLGLLAVTQVRAQDVYSRSLQLETPASLTTLIAGLAERNNALRDEIVDLKFRTTTARDAISSGKGSLTEAERQVAQLRVFEGQSAVGGPGISVRIDGAFDDRALSDLVNELRNAGAEAISVNARRVGPRTVDRACHRQLRCHTCGDDPHRRHHRPVRAHLSQYALQCHQGISIGSPGAADAASLSRG